MRKVLAVASVGSEHKELVLKDLKSIFRRIKIPLDILLQEEYAQTEKGTTSSTNTLLKAYPYITLTIPNYEQHRECTSFHTQISRKFTRITSSSANSSFSSHRGTPMRN